MGLIFESSEGYKTLNLYPDLNKCGYVWKHNTVGFEYITKFNRNYRLMKDMGDIYYTHCSSKPLNEIYEKMNQEFDRYYREMREIGDINKFYESKQVLVHPW